MSARELTASQDDGVQDEQIEGEINTRPDEPGDGRKDREHCPNPGKEDAQPESPDFSGEHQEPGQQMG
jgi:hypothetical protein